MKKYIVVLLLLVSASFIEGAKEQDCSFQVYYPWNKSMEFVNASEAMVAYHMERVVLVSKKGEFARIMTESDILEILGNQTGNRLEHSLCVSVIKRLQFLFF